ncbi:MAG: YlxR family protein [Acidimicrobiales bacterium]
MRTCIGCRRLAPCEELTRVIRRFDGTLEVGRALPGRGAWVCAGSVACVDQAERRRAFDRALRGPIVAGAARVLREEAHGCAKMGCCAGGTGATTVRRG